jgi:hypothetical protein
VIEAESQAVQNTLTEHDFEDALKMAEGLTQGGYLKGDGGQ